MRIATAVLVFLSLACNRTSGPAEDPQENKPVINAGAPFFLHLEGMIGDYPIGMELMHLPQRYGSGSGYQGYYYYQRYGEPIAFYGAEEEPGQISLSESDVEGNRTGNFRGQIDEDGVFRGRWISEDQKRVLPFELKPPADKAALNFDLLLFSDSLLIETGAEEAPRVYVSQRWLFPGAPGGNIELADFLRAEIRKHMVGDSLASLYADPAAAFQAEKAGYFADYENEIQSLLQYQQENPNEEPWFMNYEFSHDMEVYYLSSTLLTVGFLDYTFTGGAHGNYGTAVYSYDLTEKKALELRDVFKPGFEKPLSQILVAKARKKYGLAPTQPLSEIFFQDDIQPTENFGLTDKGIFFVYVPYEIASYATGQVELFVPFAEVMDWKK